MKVCFFGFDTRNYSRNTILLKGLDSLGVDVVHCYHHNYFSFEHYPSLLWQFLKKARDSDIILVPVFAYYDLFFAWIISRVFGMKVIYDPLVSIYNTRVEDRQYFEVGSFRAKLYILFDKLNVKLSDLIFIDTKSQIDYYHKMFGMPKKKAIVVRVGADQTTLIPTPHKLGKKIKLLFYGSYQPSQGALKIIETANLLKDLDLEWIFIGGGQQKDEVLSFAKSNKIKNVKFLDFMPFDQLIKYIDQTDISFGAIGDTVKSNMVIHNKIYQAVAMGKVVITQDSDAAREILTDNVNAILVSPNPEDVSRKIRKLVKNPDKIIKIGNNARKLFLENFTTDQVGKQALLGFKKVLTS